MKQPTGRRSRKRRAVTGIAVTSAALLTLGASTTSTATAAGDGPNYVALGDSYASGAGLAGVKDKACDRTTGSYASLVARSQAVAGLNRAFKDVTCSGATTRSIWNHQGDAPPQANALTPHTKLVTLTLGGNDVGFVNVLTTCATVASSDRNGSPCKGYFTAGGKDVLGERINTMEGRIRGVLADVRRRSPDAKVVVVGYPAVFPDNGVGCAEVPFAKGDFAFLRDTTKKLNRALQRQAAAGGAGMSFADTYSATVGHDMCRPRDRRWIESLTPAANTLSAHPNSTGQLVMAFAALDRIFKP
ncbi:SGNH/GDSL hydrolase family protein [Streptomyces sp. NBC_00878]|uniref:SGNH/GDSL hydrolase family protein n=1 Tax=Streptomyces sp. NBC_00878 TaxID=2975854 RepID=UPI0022536D83|nr:SGNH/GDSL hydrolase family protein [Streptomyces sp. NBC_00878]MCX4904376.1 SGNH/GDSL hydrolase family protein [Streptomyces sp. NBC_00878]